MFDRATHRAVAALLATAACTKTSSSERVPPPDPTEACPGGEATFPMGRSPTFVRPAQNIAPAAKPGFHAGKALAHQPWVRAPSSTDARDGLGPLYNARSCLVCHVEGGRGAAPDEDGRLSTATLVRLGLEAADPRGGVAPEPTYGRQLQVRSIDLAAQLGVTGDVTPEIPAEAEVRVTWARSTFTYPDGRTAKLRRPEVELEHLGYGPLHPDARLELRHTPPLTGLGLLAGIANADLEGAADPEDADGDGISGRINTVWDPELGRPRPGRFGLKANQPSLRVQVAAALRNDLGISNRVFSAQPCTDRQTGCRDAPHGHGADGHEISEDLLDLVVRFTMSIGVPERRKPDHPLVRRGREAFYRAGCQDCHRPSYVTGEVADHPHLSGQRIWPYTDLLLHDMGEGLASERRDFTATGAEWRTAPLWGIGLARAVREDAGLLHDGRARTVEEAILWHGGEARRSRDRFTRMDADLRKALIAFVKSL